MLSLNYHHLFYFWTVAREGTIARAAALLRLTEPTVGSQIHALEAALGEKLFEREGRALVLTEIGKVAYRYATEIFTLGRELQAALVGAEVATTMRLRVGLVDVVPRLIAYRLLEPALLSLEPVQLVCRNDTSDRLLVGLLTHELDAVISDAPLHSGTSVKMENRLLGECGTTIFGSKELVTRYRRGFPRSLDKAPFLLPEEGTTLRRSLEAWFDTAGIVPWVRGHFGDSALLKAFGRSGVGLFAAPTAIEREVRRDYAVGVVGRVESIRERFFIVSTRRKVPHPVVATITHSARRGLF
jgi:LysR family transcriptional regulator, transcriptional activator of nhaA